jgi:hypothetical protein
LNSSYNWNLEALINGVLTETFSVGIQLEKFVLIARISFFILPHISLLNVLGILTNKKKKPKRNTPLDAATLSPYGTWNPCKVYESKPY